ncbi:hypothetical protein PR048_004712 [Dryococelus australis]|uniref:Uncharacterized protein n=1 Tax=Dryococelus australis TaxID=614101 RepID=A0ABQ9I6K2_9NEOP|nr:hypothetical protein PR048_004712 [Dryococelus australis]
MLMSKREQYKDPLPVDRMSFKSAEKFKYLGALSTRHKVGFDIQERLQAGNICFYSLRNTLKSKALLQRTKIKIYKTIICPIVTWTTRNAHQDNIDLFKRRVMQWSLKHIQDKGEMTENKQRSLLGKWIRIQWAGHVIRMPDNAMTRAVMERIPVKHTPSEDQNYDGGMSRKIHKTVEFRLRLEE